MPLRTPWLLLLVVMVPACAPAPRDAAPTRPALRPPPSPAEAELERLNRWCAGHDDCTVAEEPGRFPGRVAHGETRGFIHAARERLAALGAGAAWDASTRRFRLAAAPPARPLPPPPPLPDELPVTIGGATEWIPAATSLSGGTSYLAVRRAVDPATGRPYDPAFTGLGGDPRRVRRGFRLERTEVLLGEPLLVELRVEVDGSDGWLEGIGGNYRGRGRDENLRFVLRRADGTFVDDAYPGPAYTFGGLSTRQAVAAGKPFSYWAAVQRYAALERPGTYDLYCFHAAHDHHVVGWREALTAAIPAALRATHRLGPDGNGLVELTSGRPSRHRLSPTWKPGDQPSPAARAVPADVARHVGAGTLASLGDYAYFRIVVKAGTAAERRRRVAEWTKVVAVPAERRWPTVRADAAREAMWFARQDDFLPLVARWLKVTPAPAPQDLHGLALRPSAAGVRLLLARPDAASVSALSFTAPARVREVVPALVEWLASPAAEVRAGAEHLLVLWTGERQGRTWDGYRSDRPTLDEARALQPRWRAWWKAHRARFVPRPLQR